MLADDRVAYPMNFFLRFEFTGSLDQHVLQRSLEESALQHPLLTATICRTAGHWGWQRKLQTTPRLHDMTRQGVAGPLRFRPLDVRHSAGLQAFLCARGNKSELWLQVHHSCADAVGVLHFVRSWFVRYEKLLSGAAQHNLMFPNQRKTWIVPDGQTCRPDLPRWRYMSPRRREWRRLANFAVHRPRRILAPERTSKATPHEAPWPAFVRRKMNWTADAWRRTKAGLPPDASLNDLLVTGLFSTIARWNDDVVKRRRDYSLRIAMPVDLRAATGNVAEARNHVSIVFLDRTSRAIRDGQDLLAGICQETGWVKNHHGAFVLHDVLNALHGVPGGIEALTAPTTCTSTTVLSNLGPLSRYLPHSQRLQLGEATLTDVDFLPPIRPGTLAAFGILTYGDEIGVGMQYDRLRLSPLIAEMLLDRVVSTWEQDLAGG
ncbi:MAG: hypothetical protein KDA42_03330 [Planctomycetales bacterium]|nr:hypothetical protein [Planctomycetales bacterium]